MKKSAIVKMISLLISIAVLFILSTSSFVAESVPKTGSIVSEIIPETVSEKVYCTATVEDEFDDNEILVVINPYANFREYTTDSFRDINCVDLEELTSDIKTGVLCRIILLTIAGNSKENVLSAIKVLENREDIYSAEPNYREHLNVIPNDEDYDIQWGLEKISLPATWNLVTGSNSIRVGIIDTGIDGTHPDLVANIDANLSRCFSPAYSNALQDVDGHGTHIAGIIGAVGNNEIGISGVCWNIKLVSLRVSYWDEVDQETYFDTSASVSAINYAEQVGIEVLNYSGGNYSTSAIGVAISNYSGVFVCSAGNDYRNTDLMLHYPSCYNYTNIISVGNSNRSDEITTWLETSEDGTTNTRGSNYGATTVDIFAPGSSIWSCMPYNVYPNRYDYLSGTSMAAPFVAGVAALYLAKHPNATPSEIRQMVIVFCDEVNALRGKSVSNGRLNAYKVLSHTHSCNFTSASGAMHNATCSDTTCGIEIFRPHSFTASGNTLVCSVCGYSSISLNSVRPEFEIS